jgi:cytosine/adenosine deaminase-related metal-dependent hydrolase
MITLRGILVNGAVSDVEIDADRIHRILPTARLDEPDSLLPPGLLMLPLFADAHVHLDKALPTDRWISRRTPDSLFEQFALEKALLRPMFDSQLQRARATAARMLACGTGRARVHVDVDPEIGTSHLETMQRLRDELRGQIDLEFVAFPQQGLLRSGSTDIVTAAVRMGATVIGAVDPGGVDQDINGCLDIVFRLAVDHGVEIDIHLHDSDWLGYATISRMADLTERFGLGGRVTISHAYCLGEIDITTLRHLGERLARVGIALTTSVPVDSAMPPVAVLTEEGVSIRLGTDHTGIDAWTPFGDPDLLRRGRLLAEKNRWNDDAHLRHAYRYFTAGPLTFQPGDPADFQLLPALCPEHALATVPSRQLIVRGGRPVAGALADLPSLQQAFATHATM